MKDRIRIATPDNVEIELELAGPGSRFLALLADTLTSWAILFGLLTLFSGARPASLFRQLDTLDAWQTAVLVILLFLLRWGYFILSEVLLGGRTPGKLLVGLRAVRDDGLPLGPLQSLIRNLLRVVDTLPPPLYLVGAVAVLASRRGQRLGDLAAGTMVVRERHPGSRGRAAADGFGADWVAKIERGSSRHLVMLPKGPIGIRQVSLIEEYFRRAPALKPEARSRLAWTIARPLLPLFDLEPGGWEGDSDLAGRCEALLREVLETARRSASDAAVPAPAVGTDRDMERKAQTWAAFAARVGRLRRRGAAALRRLSAEDMKRLLVDNRRITTDLARARSMDADPDTLSRLNRLAAAGHDVIYGRSHSGPRVDVRQWPARFAGELRSRWREAALAAFLFAASALVCFLAVRWHPELAYDLVGPEFYSFEPASAENLHDIPRLFRPVAASAILTNNLQVSILAFAFGLTAGAGTVYLLVVNGMHIGSVFGWMSRNGQLRALLGWIMPHGLTEILAILVAGSAGFCLARAILAPGRLRRSAALRRAAAQALRLELGCMAMLVVAGLIEGFVSPSALAFPVRIGVLAGSALLWAAFFLLVGRPPRTERPPSPGAGPQPSGSRSTQRRPFQDS